MDEPVEFRIYFWRVGNTDQRYERWVEIDNIRLYEPGSGETGIADPPKFDPASSYRIYPNPAKEKVEISGLSGSEDIRIFSINGQLMQSFRAGAERETLLLNHLKQGIYFVKITDSQGGTKAFKLIIN